MTDFIDNRKYCRGYYWYNEDLIEIMIMIFLETPEKTRNGNKLQIAVHTTFRMSCEFLFY